MKRSNLEILLLPLGVSVALAGLSVSPAATAIAAELDENEAAATAAIVQEEQASDSDESAIDEIVVTGSHLRLETSQMAKQVISIDAEELAAIGEPDLGRAIARIPQNFGGAMQAGAFNGSSWSMETNMLGRAANVTGAASVNLRGYGDDATLILVNGKRMRNTGLLGGVSDISSIPMSRVERIEISTDGSSAIYGADAVGGVVNIILKKDYDGFNFEMDLGTPTEGGMTEGLMALAYTHSWDGGYVTTSGDFYNSSELTAAEIPSYYSWTDSSTSILDGRVRPEYSFAPNVALSYGYDSDCGCYMYADVYGSPAGAVLPTGADIEALAPTTGDEPYALNFVGIHPDQDRINFSVMGEHALSDNINLNFGLMMQDKDTRYSRGPIQIRTKLQGNDDTYSVRDADGNYVYDIDGNRVRALYPSGQWNPYTFDIYLLGIYPELGIQESVTDSLGYTVDLGLDGILRGDWTWEVNGSYSRDKIKTIQTNPLMDRLSSGTRKDYGGNLPWNPWGDGTNNSPETMAYVLLDDDVTRTINENKQFDVRFRGSIFELPAGPVQVAVGGELRNVITDMDRPPVPFNYAGKYSGIDIGMGSFSDIEYESDIWAIYGEAHIPLLADRTMFQQLDITLAGRSEESEQTGFASSNNPNEDGTYNDPTAGGGTHKYSSDTWGIGAIWAPADFIRFKWNRSTAARAPRPEELYPPRLDDGLVAFERYGDAYNSLDRYYQLQPIARLTGANPDLESQELDSTTVTVELMPTDNFMLAGTLYDNEYSDKIIGGYSVINSTIGDAAYFADLYPGRVELYPNGDLAFMDTSLMNIAAETQKGYDVSANLQFDTAIGAFGTVVRWNHVKSNELLFLKTGEIPGRDQVGVTTPEDSISTNLRWNNDNWFASLDSIKRKGTTSYISSTYGIRRSSILYHNLVLGYNFAGGRLDGATVTLRVTNLTDEKETAEYMKNDEAIIGGLSSVSAGDARGRMVFLNVKQSF